MVKEIVTSRGAVAIVSNIDADLAAYTWHLSIEAYRLNYAVRYCTDEKGKHLRIRLHREIIERIIGRSLADGDEVDHIDGDGMNCCRDNLRVVTPSQNMANRRLNRDNKSGYKGVSWKTSDKKWRACIGFQRSKIHLGLFTDKHEAARAYNAKALELFGQYARINVIDESV